MKNKLLSYLLLFMLLASVFTCCAAAAPDKHYKVASRDAIDISKIKIDIKQFEKENNGVKFGNAVKDAQNFKVSKDLNMREIRISLKDEKSESTKQRIGVPLGDLKGFTGNLLITHYNNSGVIDYTQIIKPLVIDSVAFVDVEFSEVVITPYMSLINNWNFEDWSVDTITPDGWDRIYAGGSQGTDAKLGAHSYMITGDGGAVLGEIHQTANISNAYYTLGTWIKVEGASAGRLSVDMFYDGHYAGGASWTGNTDWRWVETRSQVTGSVGTVRIFADQTPTTGAKFYVDGIILSPDYSYTATESISGNRIYQSFVYTPDSTFTSSTFLTQFESYDLTNYYNPILSVKVDGVTRDSWLADESLIFFDTSGVTNGVAHNVNVSVAYTYQPPVANFGVNDTYGAAPLHVAFTDTSTKNPTSWLWNFGDGTTSTAQNPLHTYNSAGVYTVTLTATSYDGSDTETKTGYITAVETPVAEFSWGRPGIYSYGFVDQSAKIPSAWAWEFGDGATSNAQNPSHTYAGFGTYVVNLTVTNEAGQSAKSHNLIIAAMPTDVISPTCPEWQYVEYNQSVEFNYSTPYGVLVSHWYINGNEINSTGLNLSYTFTDPGRATNVSVWCETTEGNSSMIEYRTMTGREVATEHLVPSNSTTYEDLENSLMDLNTSGILTYSITPYTDLIGRMFYCVIFILPFIFIWFQTQKLTVATTLALIVGCVFIGFIPSQFTAFIGIVIVMSFASAFYKLSRGP